MKELTPAQRRDLRARAHHLDPVVSIAANGLTASVLKEIDRNLTAHELIKVRVYGDDREKRVELMNALCAELGCSPVQSIGKLLVVFRIKPAEEPTPVKARPRTSVRKPLTPKPESGRTARTTTGTSAVRRFGASKLAPRRPTGNGRSGARGKPGPSSR